MTAVGIVLLALASWHRDRKLTLKIGRLRLIDMEERVNQLEVVKIDGKIKAFLFFHE